MLGNHSKTIRHYLVLPALLVLLGIGTSANATLIEYKLDLWGPGYHAKYPISADLQSAGTLTGDFNNGVLTDIAGETPLITITEGYIASGKHQYDNYAYGTFKTNEYVPEFFQGKGIFLDLARGAEYIAAVVTETTIREWAWVLYIFDEVFTNQESVDDVKARKYAFSEHAKTVRKQKKTFKQLCYYYGSCDKAGGEFYGDHGKPVPDTPIPIPAAFYLFTAGIAGLITVSRKRNSANI